ncbi:branched-chain amino acid ABC transporter permease [Archaeoglobus fulgidus]|jgi:branched-chain amino acid transport system permease protein|uniref:Branched-chain amino acid ABC transporter, permease protein (BraE-2) n=3 Tax=Archaeoglobus fulgidus TaxID=2234 RepID=O29434_ARCFU|nr:branched-chain amino acid ABC transporter permease [Archaeoglobus fulgidus]AAB90411.1 branched-chain amino acid ABC transporter, permease protein (braE-2) [Archaeoglobus fulgidus DSM 4304]AIG97702.1 ABC-type branched-chain amino acid transport system, permease component [Archaeoglobus fulgidus DSM 8774]KUJ92990.1 MAG: Branched-chain amino acid ABC transporter, permease protein (BraE-2) [Archaeoglobus fulgidus]KUK06513.1 MAG: Branched-chain amino acid ABC transporter, permease protein (BraE-2
MNWKFVYPVILILAVLLPLTGSSYALRISTLFIIYTIAAMGLNIIIGYTGQASLAQGAFYGLGAYVSALLVLNGWSFWASVIVAIAFVAFVAFLIGLMTLRLKGAYFAIATLLFNVIIYEVVDKWDEVTRGPRGLFGIPSPSIELSGISISFSGTYNFYYLMLAVLIVMTLLYWLIIRSSFGSIIVAIRENELLAEYAGVNLTKFKVASFVLSAIFAAVAGAFYSAYIGSIFPDITSFVNSFAFLTAIIFGGAGTMLGPFIGTAVVTLINEVFFTLAQYTVLVQGIVFLLAILFMPKGVMGAYYSRKAEKGEKLPKRALVGKF